MIRIFVAVTHKPWFDFLSTLAPDEVNFWQPSGGRGFQALSPGELFLFKLKSPFNVIAGGGIFSHSTAAPLSLAWEAFGQKNGVATLADMRRTIAQLRRIPGALTEREDPVVGCRILTQPFFWPPEKWLPVPAGFAREVVTGKGYSTADPDGLALWEAVNSNVNLMTGSGVNAPAQSRYGEPAPIRPRLGQGAFRLKVTDAYDRRCAISGEKTLPILDAAHIRSYESGGEHELSNGLLLRTDIHRLFDRGYVTVSEKGRFAVSERLKADFDNGAHYYAMQGREIALPRRGFTPPAEEALKWHREERYLG